MSERACLSSNERRALAEFKKPETAINWGRVHGHTLHALQRKKLIEGRKGNLPGWKLTAAGRRALIVPNIFDDLFKKKKDFHVLTDAEIDAHPLLDQDQRKICKGLRNLAKKKQRPFTMLEFAEIALRAAGNDYAAVTDQGGAQAARADSAHRRAAILYVHEVIKHGPAIIGDTTNTLRDLGFLASHGVDR